MAQHETIDYVEYPSCDLRATKTFFEKVFNWSFQDYGPEYTAFTSPRLEGGFYKSDLKSRVNKGAPLLIFYSGDLAATQKKIEQAGGTILKSPYSFPGGRRFHFAEPSGNEMAVWSEK